MKKKDLNGLTGITRVPRASMRARCLVALLVLVIGAPANSTRAQSCNPAAVNYIVRDEQGKGLNSTALNAVAERLPKSIADARVDVGETSFADDGKTFYWPESIAWAKGKLVPSLQFSNAATCTLQLTEVTLVYHKKKMRLIFNLEISRSQPDRRPVIDSLPFQAGTFMLDLTGWSHDRDQIISAKRWRKVKGKTSAGSTPD